MKNHKFILIYDFFKSGMVPITELYISKYIFSEINKNFYELLSNRYQTNPRCKEINYKFYLQDLF